MIKVLVDNGHGVETPGKRSPDGRLREYKYAREIAASVVARLKELGYDAGLIVEEDRDVSLQDRCKRVNNWCELKGSKNVILVSVHELAYCLYDAAKEALPGKKMRTDYSDGDPDIEAGFYILKHTRCAAVLTENFFQDNKQDVDFLLSNEGRESIVQLHVNGIVNYIKQVK